jgi:hypothetical protein
MLLPAVRLMLGAVESRVQVLETHAFREMRLPIGSSAVAEIFRSDPPTERELESAIDLIEEAVMPFAKEVPPGSALIAGDALTCEVAALGAGDQIVERVSIDAVEGLFDQLARAGRRGTWVGTTRMDATLAAAVVILREFMHHAGFLTIQLREGDGLRQPG